MQPGAGIRVVGAREAYRAWTAGEVAIVDVREEAEHIVTRVPGVPLLPLSELLERFEELPEGPLVVMCRSGSRSAAVVEYLRDRGGRPDAANLEGGILAWAAEGLPYEGEPPR